jgi:hypothetical protein
MWLRFWEKANKSNLRKRSLKRRKKRKKRRKNKSKNLKGHHLQLDWPKNLSKPSNPNSLSNLNLNLLIKK